MKDYEANDAVLVVNGHTIYGFTESDTYVSRQIQKAEESFQKKQIKH